MQTLGLNWEGTFITSSRTSRDLTESSPIFICLVLNSHVLSSSQPPPSKLPLLKNVFQQQVLRILMCSFGVAQSAGGTLRERGFHRQLGELQLHLLRAGGLY